jgi:hypothetical protein
MLDERLALLDPSDDLRGRKYVQEEVRRENVGSLRFKWPVGRETCLHRLTPAVRYGPFHLWR